jgi:hypothetical protein
MKTRLFGLFTAGILCAACLAQQPAPADSSSVTPQTPQTGSSQSAPSSQPQTSASPRIAPGSVIPVQLTKTIDAKKIKTGDPVEAKVTQDLKNGNGELVVPKDTKIMGHVTEAQVRSKEQKESQVGITFDHAVLKNGGDEQLPMSIQAIISPTGMNSNAGNGASDTSNQPAAAPSGGGTYGNSSGRGGMGAGSTPQPSTTSARSDAPNDAQARGQQPITGNTQGVVGIPNLKLSTEPNPTQGSLLSSEKNNVKLDSGTLLLLRVNQQ